MTRATTRTLATPGARSRHGAGSGLISAARLGLCILLLAALPAAAQAPIEVEVGMAPQEITVGDPVSIEISVAPPTGSGVPVLPDWRSGRWGRAEILEVGDVQQTPAGPGVSRYTQRLVITAFEVGEIELPPVEVELPSRTGESRVAKSSPRSLRVVSVLPAEAGSEAAIEPRPPAKLRALPAGTAFWSTLGLLSLAAALLIAWLMRADPEVEVVRPQLDPLDEFDRLVRDLGREPDPVTFHTRLSFALRRFLGRTLGFGAVESTTTQIQQRLRQHALATDTVRHAAQMLRDCDQVKFARILAGRRGAEETLADAGRLARSVYREVKPPEPDAAEGRPS